MNNNDGQRICFIPMAALRICIHFIQRLCNMYRRGVHLSDGASMECIIPAKPGQVSALRPFPSRIFYARAVLYRLSKLDSEECASVAGCCIHRRCNEISPELAVGSTRRLAVLARRPTDRRLRMVNAEFHGGFNSANEPCLFCC